ncbi:ATP-dependent Clp protease proteolytic subunit [Aliidiomarina quisquiliarum]|uniref:ATP-dependent Clp protease proteolytic subunit n=2 Tax=Bacteria TaxID=2 RepID=UPI00208DE46B|nr:ATP-dependent Clp protease proteolytic subunit [Aliidiomarina quisquiliarum]MCO4321725.1 ATP-dependent Clp protease proteolytic subunit [Aliidiomarina quisquiliarum]
MKIVAQVFVLAVALAACTTTTSQPEHGHPAFGESTVYLQGNTLIYLGEITKAQNELAYKLAAEARLTGTKSVALFHIDSSGGSVQYGIELAEWIKAQELDVSIGYLCASSCANYILAAGKRTYLAPYSTLMWHGSSYQKSISKKVQQGDENSYKWRKLEQAFFASANVSSLMTVCGFDHINIVDELLARLKITPIAGFTYSSTDLYRFGLTNIILPEQGWHPANKLFGQKIAKTKHCESVSWQFGSVEP